MPVLTPYLTFNGSCLEALRFYERVLGGTIEMTMTMGQSPLAAKMPPGSADRILHAWITIHGQSVAACDTMAGRPSGGMHGFHLLLSFDTAAEATPVFAALAEGGTVTMPLEATFWAQAFGMLTDRFGTPWMINAGGRQ